MPQIKEGQSYNPQPTVANKLFRERLMDRFKASDWVRVINIDTEEFVWFYTPTSGEDITFDNGSMPMKNVRREPPQMWKLDAGESEVIQGENAYLMVENLYKKLVAKQVVSKDPERPNHQARNFNWNDPQTQEDYIDKIYLGKESPRFDTYEAQSTVYGEPQDQVYEVEKPKKSSK